MTISRSGLLSCCLSLFIIFCYGFLKRQKLLVFSVPKVVLAALLFILLFGAFSRYSRGYMELFMGPMGTGSFQRFNQKGTSEGNRLSNIFECLTVWGDNLFLGNGVVTQDADTSRGLSQIAMNTWLEIGMESGVVGFVTFLFAVLATMREALLKNLNKTITGIILAGWIAHFAIHLNLTQTFPRLDYWLLFFLSVQLLLHPHNSQLSDAKIKINPLHPAA